MGPRDETSGSKIPEVKSLNDLISELHKVFESDRVNVEYVSSLMESYKSNFADWKEFSKFDEHKLAKNLVDEGNGKYNLIVVCWGPDHKSTIHDHADSHCFMKILDGDLNEVRYAWPEDKDDKGEVLKQISHKQLNLNEVSYMSDELGLHRMENSSDQVTAVSLHLYCPPIIVASVFDEKTGHKTKSQVTFWSKYGERSAV